MTVREKMTMRVHNYLSEDDSEGEDDNESA